MNRLKSRLTETMKRAVRRRFLLGVTAALLAGGLEAPSAQADPVFFYNSSTGTGVTSSISSSDWLTNQQVYKGFSPWTHVTSVDGGVDPVSLRGYRFLFFYNSITRTAATSRIYDGWGYAFVRAMSGFGRWTHVVGLPISGGLMLFVNAYTGLGATGRVNTDGTFVHLKTIGGFAPWTHITGLYGGMVLFYNASTGLGATGRVNTDGTFVHLKTIPGLWTWTHVTGCGSYPDDPGRVLFYNASTGVGATARVKPDEDGRLVNLQSITRLPPATHIAGFRDGLLLFYNAFIREGETTRVGVVGRVNADGSYAPLKVISGFGPWTHVVGESSDGRPGEYYPGAP